MGFRIRSRWIPKSEKGRKVARYLRARGYDARNREVCGRYVCNLPMFAELTHEEFGEIAIILDSERAYDEWWNSVELAGAIREQPEEYGYTTTEDAVEAADRIERDWMF